MIQAGKHCSNCKQQTLHEHQCFTFGWGCLLTIITGGIFIPIWLIIKVNEAFMPWRCQVCGNSKLI